MKTTKLEDNHQDSNLLPLFSMQNAKFNLIFLDFY